MSDVDDELLALAGGDVSSDEEASVTRSRGESRSPPPTPAAKKKDAPARGVATKKTPAKKAKRRSRGDDDSEEEGEAFSGPASPSSLQSAPMDESDSDADSPPPASREDDENKYPVEGLFLSYAEKEDIMGMREVEREQLLADRAQEKDRILQNRLLRQLVSNEEQRNKKRSASAADLEEGQRKTSRVRTKLGGTRVGETNAALDTLKTRRAEKTERTRRREEDRERRRDRSPSYRDDDDDRDGESDVDWARPSKSKVRSRSPEIKDTAPVELHDVERVRLSRSRFGQVCFYPGFEQAITGCFVRISIGPAPETGQPVYRMAIIKGFTTGRAYVLLGAQGQQVVTDQYCIAAHGKAQKEWPFIACSDSGFTEAEWTRYQRICQSEGVTVPLRPALHKKADDINKLINRPWTGDELNNKLKRQQELKNRFNGIRRKQLENELADARRAGADADAERLQDELDRLGTPRLAFRTSLAPAATTAGAGADSTQQERLAAVNAEHRRLNADQVRRAQLRERARARDIEKRIERGEAVDEDTSRRLKTRAKFIHDINDVHDPRSASQAGSGASTPAAGATPRLGPAGPKPAASLLPHLAKLAQQQKAVDKNGIPTIHKPIMDDDIIAALDLEIDEDILG